MIRASIVTAALFFACTALAQSQFTNDVSNQTHDQTFQLGGNVWFAPMQNYYAQSGKYIALYVTAPRATTINVQQGSNTAGRMSKEVNANEVVTFLLPNSWEMTSTDVVENKAVHVWSNDVVICAYLMSHSPYTSDGSYLLPTIAWGPDYTVGAFAALDQPNAGSDGDNPSEFVIVANQDNTTVSITPSCDLRDSKQALTAAHPKGQLFSITLNRGDVIQYKSTRGEAANDMDVTGTLIHSNVPVGVLAGSQCPFIPVDDPYCDHILEMMLPMNRWGKTYYTAPYAKRKNGDTFGLLGSAPNQVIYRTVNNVKTTYAVLTPGVPFWDNSVVDAAKWESDKPFMLIQYMNSSTHDGQTGSFGDPSECMITPMESFANPVVFQTPTNQGSQAPYQNYVNIIVRNDAAASTTIDGVALAGTPMAIDNTYEVYRIDKINGTPLKAGTHIVKSTKPVGVYIYGYGSYESYAWSSPFFAALPGSSDTVPPIASFSNHGSSLVVALQEGGALSAGIASIQVDSANNIRFGTDQSWVEGVTQNSTSYNVVPIDSSRSGYLRVSIYDLAGNRTSVVSSYEGMGGGGAPDFTVDDQVWQDVPLAGPSVQKAVTIRNSSKAQAIHITNITVDKPQFMFDPSILTGPGILIPANDTAIVLFTFNPSDTAMVRATVSWKSPDVVEADGITPMVRTSHLTGNGVALAAVASTQKGSLRVAQIGETLRIVSTDETGATSHLELFNSLGEEVLRSNAPVVDVHTLPHGVYFYRLSAGRESVTGKIVL